MRLRSTRRFYGVSKFSPIKSRKFTAEPELKHLPRSYSAGNLLPLANAARESARRIDENHREIYFAHKILGKHSCVASRRFYLKRIPRQTSRFRNHPPKEEFLGSKHIFTFEIHTLVNATWEVLRIKIPKFIEKFTNQKKKKKNLDKKQRTTYDFDRVWNKFEPTVLSGSPQSDYYWNRVKHNNYRKMIKW